MDLALTDFDRMRRGMEIFEAYGENTLWAEHDEIHAGPHPREVDPVDKAELDQLGWSVWEDEHYVMYV